MAFELQVGDFDYGRTTGLVIRTRTHVLELLWNSAQRRRERKLMLDLRLHFGKRYIGPVSF